jgi:hypothetical protein
MTVKDPYGPQEFVKGMPGNARVHEGVAQGSPTGPLLSTQCLTDFLSQRKSLSYADDGFFYSDKDFLVKGESRYPGTYDPKLDSYRVVDQPEKGIIFNYNKCG